MEPLAALALRIAASFRDRPILVGIAGAVAVGKSTVARLLADELQERGRRVGVVATDGFLLPNAILERRGLSYRKGFPESFDLDALAAFVRAVRDGKFPLHAPVYSHEVYDVVEGASEFVEECDVLVLEGVVALHDAIVPLLDEAVYLHAEEPVVREWFVERFLDLVEVARDVPASFYRAFTQMQPGRVREIAEATWDGINAVNLREHILPSRVRATAVLTLDANHTIGV